MTRCGVNAGARVLDLACGTGTVTRVAAPMLGPDGEIVGVDRSEALVRRGAEPARRSFDLYD